MTHTHNNVTYTIPVGLAIWTVNDTVRSDDCSAWAYHGEPIRHSSRCDTETLQAVAAVEARHTMLVADVYVPTVSDGGAIDWSKIRRGTKEWEAAMFYYGEGGGNYDLI